MFKFIRQLGVKCDDFRSNLWYYSSRKNNILSLNSLKEIEISYTKWQFNLDRKNKKKLTDMEKIPHVSIYSCVSLLISAQ